MHCLVNVYCEKFTLVFIIKLMELSRKIEMPHFRVSDIIVTRWVITRIDFLTVHNCHFGKFITITTRNITFYDTYSTTVLLEPP